VAVVERNQSVVGDSYAMGVTAEIVQYILGTAEGWFGVDDPVSSEQWPEPGSEDLGLSEQCQIAGKVKLAMLKGRLETVDELAAKDASEHRDREKESRMGSNPTGVIEREPAGGNDTVDVGVSLELLIPGVQHAEEADLGTKMDGVASHFQ
jgi:hypothetical protein